MPELPLRPFEDCEKTTVASFVSPATIERLLQPRPGPPTTGRLTWVVLQLDGEHASTAEAFDAMWPHIGGNHRHLSVARFDDSLWAFLHKGDRTTIELQGLPVRAAYEIKKLAGGQATRNAIAQFGSAWFERASEATSNFRVTGKLPALGLEAHSLCAALCSSILFCCCCCCCCCCCSCCCCYCCCCCCCCCWTLLFYPTHASRSQVRGQALFEPPWNYQGSDSMFEYQKAALPADAEENAKAAADEAATVAMAAESQRKRKAEEDLRTDESAKKAKLTPDQLRAQNWVQPHLCGCGVKYWRQVCGPVFCRCRVR
jgi:hypothetical protein